MPQGARTDRVGDLVRQELGMLLTQEVRDPGVRAITITRVRMTRDLQHAQVYYTTLADDLREASRALKRARPFLKRQLGRRLRLRFVPDLTFVYDEAVERELRVAQLLTEIDTPDGDASQ